ncbi:hypothetical protein QBC38DRAFT_459812 [Podospora fimiseda]|uniref:F-box domain-containing protein n=1 Tax=Podospora fimiseda TaxID=252190 RepID=A0AAN6YPG4_9PEZI|nr:hypothetical protein QBC38DRAFT_459812 [Podospora fimiseda]
MDRIQDFNAKRKGSLDDNSQPQSKELRLTEETVANDSETAAAMIMDLPQEILDLIATYLEPREVLAMSMASKHLYDVLAAARWNRVVFSNA